MNFTTEDTKDRKPDWRATRMYNLVSFVSFVVNLLADLDRRPRNVTLARSGEGIR